MGEVRESGGGIPFVEGVAEGGRGVSGVARPPVELGVGGSARGAGELAEGREDGGGETGGVDGGVKVRASESSDGEEPALPGA